MEEFFLKMTKKKVQLPSNSKNITFVDYETIIKGDIKEIFSYKFPEENFLKLKVCDSESKNVIITLQNYRWKSQISETKGVVLFFHGLNAHINSGAFLASKLTEIGYDVVGYDQRGFGKSDGLRGHIESFSTIYNDARVFFSMILELYKGKKIFLLGISMGGLISYRLSLDYPNEVKGAILLSPALTPPMKDVFVKIGILLGSFLRKIPLVKPKIEIAMKSEIAVQRTKDDPFQYNGGTRMGTLKALLVEMKDCWKTFDKFTTNVLIFIGGKDEVIGISGGLDLIEMCKSDNKHLYYYSNLYHDIWNEEELYDISDKIINWVENI